MIQETTGQTMIRSYALHAFKENILGSFNTHLIRDCHGYHEVMLTFKERLAQAKYIAKACINLYKEYPQNIIDINL